MNENLILNLFFNTTNKKKDNDRHPQCFVLNINNSQVFNFLIKLHTE